MTTRDLVVATLLTLLVAAPILYLIQRAWRRLLPSERMKKRRDYLIIVVGFVAVFGIASILGFRPPGMQIGPKKEFLAMIFICPFFAWQLVRGEEAPWLDEVGTVVAVAAASFGGL